MKILCDIETNDINSYIENGADAFILYLKDYSVGTNTYFELDDIKKIVTKYDKEFFISINKNMFNKDLNHLEEILISLSKLPIKGVIFYDMSILQIKRKNNLNINLVWNQEHMTTNYNTCNYYYDRGVKYSYLSSEIMLNEMIEIKENSNVIPLVLVVGRNFVAHSRRKLITNYYNDLKEAGKNKLEILEKISNDTYTIVENQNGSSFSLNKIMNGTSIIKELYENKFPYIILKESGIDKKTFLQLISDTKNYIKNNCKSSLYIEKYKNILGDYTGFLFKKTIYKVKSNEKN